MRTALCLSGQLRTFNSCYPSLKKYILDCFHPDVFVHTWYEQGDVSIQRDKDQMDSGKSKAVVDITKISALLDTKKTFLEHFNPIMFDSLDGVSKPEHLWGVYHENKGMLPMFYSIYKCNLLKQQYERENNTEYDMVIRTRPDLEYLNYMPQTVINGFKNDNNIVFIPTWNKHSNISFNDTFAFGNSENIDRYCNCWKQLQDMWDDYDYKNMCETERVLYQYLNDNNVDVKKFLPFYILRRYNHSNKNIFLKKTVNRYVPNVFRNSYHNNKTIKKRMPFNMVEVETHTTCNRSCPYCPVNNNRREKHTMSTDLFKKIVDDLEDIQYSGLFSLMRYNEPLLEERLPMFVSYVKKQLPGCSVKIFTNGDYLNYVAFKKLLGVGVDCFEVTNHWVKDSLPFNRHLKNFRDDLSLGDRKHIIFKEYHSGSVMNNRGGLVTSLFDMRFNGCGPYQNLPLNPQLEVDSFGNVLLCCRQYSKDFGPMFGNVKNVHVMDVWMNPVFVKTRSELRSGVRSLDICKRCGHGFWKPDDKMEV